MGIWNINCTFQNLTNTTTLTVNHAAATNFTLTPENATLNSGVSQIYSTLASDAYTNIWDSTNLTVFSINSAPGGSWNLGNYTSGNMGNWTITSDYSGFRQTSTLRVYYSAGFRIRMAELTLMIYNFLS